MTKDQIYEIWRPATSPWSRWVKPVLFSFLREEDLKLARRSVPEWRVPGAPDIAIIVDLPGADGVTVGVALAREGYRPVPVYNACPFATYLPDTSLMVFAAEAQQLPGPVVVNVLPIMAALCETVQELQDAKLDASASPAFLLDSNRRGQILVPDPGSFDNRSFITPTDFPSPDLFRQHGIYQIVLVQTESKIQIDLLQVLLTLQRGGMMMARQAPREPWAPTPITVRRPPIVVDAWEWLRRKLGFRRNAFGSFGEIVPPSTG